MRRSSLAGMLLLLVQTDACTDTCAYASDGQCDDGGYGSSWSYCVRGSDCTDCGGSGTVPDPACTTACGDSGWSGTGAPAVGGRCYRCWNPSGFLISTARQPITETTDGNLNEMSAATSTPARPHRRRRRRPTRRPPRIRLAFAHPQGRFALGPQVQRFTHAPPAEQGVPRTTATAAIVKGATQLPSCSVLNSLARPAPHPAWTQLP